MISEASLLVWRRSLGWSGFVKDEDHYYEEYDEPEYEPITSGNTIIAWIGTRGRGRM